MSVASHFDMGMPVTQQTLTGKTKDCAVCALPIPADDTVCTQCNNSQSALTRNVKSMAVVGAGIAALLPLFDAACSLRKIVAGQHRAEIQIQALSCQPSGIPIAAMNFGRGPAFITDPSFHAEGAAAGGSTIGVHMNQKGSLYQDAMVVETSGVKTIQLIGWMGPASTDLPRAPKASGCTYHVSFAVHDVGGSVQKEAVCSCPSS